MKHALSRLIPFFVFVFGLPAGAFTMETDIFGPVNPAYRAGTETNMVTIGAGLSAGDGDIRGEYGTVALDYLSRRATLFGDISGIVVQGSENSEVIGVMAAGVAKKIDARWSIGSGIRGIAGTGTGSAVRSGILVDAGVYRNNRTYAPATGGSFGVAVVGIGKPYDSSGDVFPPVPSFMPILNGELPYIRDEKIAVATSVYAGFSGATGIESGVRLTARIGANLELGVGRSWSVNDGFSPFSATLRYRKNTNSFGAGITGYSGMPPFIRTEIRIEEVLKDRDGPELAYGPPETTVISPNNDGVLDAVTIHAEAVDRDSVSYLEIVVIDASGIPVRNFRFDPAPGAYVSWSELGEALVGTYGNSRIGGSFTWDGRTAGGQVVPDGEYRVILESADRFGNERRIEIPERIRIDTTPPQVPRFQPTRELWGTDSGPVEFSVEDSGSDRLSWDVHIVDAFDRAIGTISYANGVDTVTWDRKTRNDVYAGDGQYRLSISGSDTAGNVAEWNSQWFHLRQESPRVSLRTDTQYWSPSSPDRDGSVFLDVAPLHSLLSWELTIADGNRVYRREGIDLPPERFFLSDTGNRRDGAELEVSAKVLFTDGLIVERGPLMVQVDAEPPVVSFRIDRPEITPDGDGVSDEVVAYVDTQEEALWEILVRTAGGKELNSRRWNGEFPFQIRWVPHGTDESLPPPGEYRMVIRGTDRAGNTTEVERPFTILPLPAGYVLSSSVYEFSPNGDGNKDFFVVAVNSASSSPVPERSVYRFEISDSRGNPVRRAEGIGRPVPRYEWNGLDGQGRPARDGEYSVLLITEEPGSAGQETKPLRFILDTRPPEPVIEVSGPVFSPDGDGRLDTVTITYGADEDSEAILTVVNKSREETVAEFPVGSVLRGVPRRFVWNGLTSGGTPAPDGDYALSVIATDSAGNSRRSTEAAVRILTRPVLAAVGADFARFSPNADGIRDEIRFSLILGDSDGTDSWSFFLNTANGEPVFRSGGSGAPPESIVWDGITDAGTRIADGAYRAFFSVDYAYGPQASARSQEVYVDTDPPELTVLLPETAFSPDGDGLDDTLEMEITINDAANIAYWHLTIFDRNGNLFHDTGGRGSPDRAVVWNGINSVGTRVNSAETYTFTVETSDQIGNRTSASGTFETGLLIEKRGDQYVIRIPSIEFSAETGELIVSAGSPAGEKNTRIMNALVEILDRYPEYRVVVEGHLINRTGTETEEVSELDPLSRILAESVVQLLVARGIPEGRVSWTGRGGNAPIVPHNDLVNRWQNQRIDVVLVR